MKKKKKAQLLTLLSTLTLLGGVINARKELADTDVIFEPEEYKITESSDKNDNLDTNITEIQVDMGNNVEEKIIIDTTPNTDVADTYTPNVNETVEEVTEQTPVVEETKVESTEPIIKLMPIDTFNEVDSYAYLLQDSIIYDNYKDEPIELNRIEQYQKVYVSCTNGAYGFICTDDGQYGYIKMSDLEYLPKDFIELDISDQVVKVYKDNEVVLNADVVTGSPATPTDLGYTEILEITFDRYLVGKDYKVFVHAFIVFNENAEGYHDLQARREFGGNVYTYNGSHGCCNMRLEDVNVMVEYVEVGTKNLVHN